jgi:hypothetical protein
MGEEGGVVLLNFLLSFPVVVKLLPVAVINLPRPYQGCLLFLNVMGEEEEEEEMIRKS